MNAFELDLENNRLTLGSVAQGPVTIEDSELKFSERRRSPYASSGERDKNTLSGIIKGNFTGVIKNQVTIPITIPHSTNQDYANYNIIIVGAGGTGGYLIRDLSRYIFALKEKGSTKNFSMTIIDGDVVEEKNVLRQNFTKRDVGQNKAEVMAKRHAMAFGIQIDSISEMATTSILRSAFIQSYDTARNRPNCNIVIGCVDNHAARREIKKAVRGTDCYWIDSGNEKKSGQVVVGTGNIRSHYGSFTNSAGGKYALPYITDIFPEILDPKKDEVEEKKESCAERSMQEAQSIQINITAANHILNFVTAILEGQTLTSHGVEFNLKGITTPMHLTNEYLEQAREKAEGAPYV